MGNIRVNYAKNSTTLALEIVDEDNYYPFGLKHFISYISLPPSNNKYKYNGKELQDELGLGFYDYDARNYDPALGRWMNIDPLAEKSRRFNPYTYALNNSVFFIDPDGMQAKPMDINFDTNSDNFKNAPQYLSSTVVDNNGKIIDHKDDGDDNIYLNKRGGEVVGKERDGVTYEKDKKIVQDDLTSNHFLFSNGIGKIENIKPVKPTYGIVLINPVALEVAIVEGFGLLMETVEGSIVFDSFAQRGNNNGKLQDDELQAIKARKEAGTASSSDLQKLKKHEKNTNQRSSRQSKNKK